MIGQNNSNDVLYNDYLKSYLSAINMKLNWFRRTRNNHQNRSVYLFNVLCSPGDDALEFRANSGIKMLPDASGTPPAGSICYYNQL